MSEQDKTQNTAMPGESLDIAAQRRAELKQLFPGAFTETVNDKGELVESIDFERLKTELGAFSDFFDGRRERYGMDWPGKRDCLKLIQQPSRATLKPCREESVDFDTTQNLFIEGDNLEVLKLLQKSYYGRIKMIYIDPPYNTGKEFIYPDNYSESLETYLAYAGLMDAEGKKFSTNTANEGRFHTRWLNMIYPRLYLARNLLREDGIIFISIDDNEVENLRRMCDEIFGEENFCSCFVWNTEGNTDNQYIVKVKHEYVLAYFKNSSHADNAVGNVIDPNTPEESNLWKGIADNNVNKNNPENPPSIVELPVGFPCSEEKLFYAKKNLDEAFFEITKREKFISDAVKEKYGIENKSGLPVKIDDMIVENYKLAKPCRIYVGMANKNKLVEFIKNDCKGINDEGSPLRFYINSNAAVRYRRDESTPRNIVSVLKNFGTTEKTKTYLKKLGITYDYPKPIKLIEYLVKIGCEQNDGIVLDFFSGSGTTGHAVINKNLEESKNRKFILVQLPEKTDFLGEGNNTRTLADICRDRLRRVISDIKSKSESQFDFGAVSNVDIGFKSLKLDQSNFTQWRPLATNVSDDQLKEQLEMQVDHIDPKAQKEAILYELLLKSGIQPTKKIESSKLADHEVYLVEDGHLILCLEDKISRELIDAVVERKPQTFICLDKAFHGNDQLKANAVETFAAHNEGLEKIDRIEFRTV